MMLYGGAFLKLSNVTKIVCEGNSITQEGRGFPINKTANPEPGYPDQLATHPAITAAGITVHNVAIGGTDTRQAINRAAANVDPKLSGPGEKILIFWEFTNSIYAGRGAQGAYNDFAEYCLARKAAGWQYIIVLSALARNRSGGSSLSTIDLSKNPILNAANALLYADWQRIATQILDVRQVPQLDPIQPEYIPDQVHPNAIAHGHLVNALVPILQRMPLRR